MNFKHYLENKNITIYKLSKETGVPYSTLLDLANEKTVFSNISLDHAIKIADYLKLDCKALLKFNNFSKDEFRIFRGNLLHELKRRNPINFSNFVIQKRYIDYYMKNGAYEEGLYLLALIDYISRINDMPTYTKRYNNYRKAKLAKPFFVGSSLIGFDSIEEAETKLNIKVIPEFKKYNIIEEDVFNIA